MSWATWRSVLREIATGVAAGIIVLLLEGAAFPASDPPQFTGVEDRPSDEVAGIVTPRPDTPRETHTLEDLPPDVGPPLEWTCPGSRPGEQVRLHLYLIAKDYSWVKGEVDQIDLHYTQKSLFPLLQAPGVQQRLKQADRLVAIGTSSCENEDRRREEIRSLARARQLSRWIEQAYGADHEPMVLPLGQYEGECPQEASETAYQRRVAIVALEQDGAPHNLGECLEHVFGQQSQGGQFPPFLARYSLPKRCTLDELLRIDTHGFDHAACVRRAQR